MATARCLLGGLILCLVLSGCTAGQDDPEADPPAPSPTQSPAPSASEVEDFAHEPLVLVTQATTPRLSLSRAGLRTALRGSLSAWRVVAAPGTPVPAVVPTLASARAVIRMVERDRWALGVLPAHAVTPTVRTALVGGVDPMRDPGDYPIQVAGPTPPEPTTVTVVGDVMLTRGVPDAAAALRPLSGRLRSADVTVGNLESTLSRDGAPQQGTDSFGADPLVLEPLQRAGFDALSLANNHTGDYEDAALLETVRLLRQSPIEPFGAGADLTAASRAAVVERHGTTFGFLGFNAIGETPEATASGPGALSISMPPRTGPLDVAELRRVQRIVRDLDRRVDVVVVVPHWGEQYTHAPWPVQRLVARRLVDAGADVVAGGHPHWVQGVDAYRGAVVAHSLGNFVFDMDFATETQQGVLMETTFWGDRLVAMDLVPYRMGPGFAPAPAAPREAADILADVWSTSTGPFRAR